MVVLEVSDLVLAVLVDVCVFVDTVLEEVSDAELVVRVEV